MMTKREYYDLLVKSAHDGTFPSIENGTCCYRLDGGKKKCAVGLLLTDVEASIISNSAALLEVIRNHPDIDLTHRVEGVDILNLVSIQKVHDQSAHEESSPEAFATQFLERLNALPIFKEFQPS